MRNIKFGEMIYKKVCSFHFSFKIWLQMIVLVNWDITKAHGYDITELLNYTTETHKLDI
jgi:hypothetical protein